MRREQTDKRWFVRRHNVKLVRGYYQLEVDWLTDLIAELKQKQHKEWDEDKRMGKNGQVQEFNVEN